MISVVIPFYYGNKYIKKTVKILEKNNSLLQKETGQELEIIIINDSPAESVDLNLSEYSVLIKIINNSNNLGIHKSRVKGLELINGEYIFFLDQDDLVSDNYVYSQYVHLFGADFVVANGYMESKKHEKIALYKSLRTQNKCLKSIYYYFYTNPIVSPGQVLIKKDAIPYEWKNASLSSNGADDCFLWLLMLESQKKGTINPEKLYTHVYTGSNTSLDAIQMNNSINELIKNMKGKTSKFNLWVLKRRSLYYTYYRNNLIYKIKYLDVGIARYIFSK